MKKNIHKKEEKHSQNWIKKNVHKRPKGGTKKKEYAMKREENNTLQK